MARFKYAVCEWAVAQRGLELCRVARRLGLHGIQLGVGVEAAEGEGLLDERVADEYLRGREEYGIQLISISVTALDHFSMSRAETDAEYDKAMGLIAQSIDLAQRMGIGMVMCPSFNRSAIVDKPSFEQTAANYDQLCAYAAGKGVMLSTESSMAADDIIKLVEHVGADKLRVYFDSQNHYLKDRTDMPGLFRKLEPYLCGELHVKDGIDDSLSGALLGEGTTDFFGTANAIRESSFSGYIVLENYYHLPPLSSQGDVEGLLAKDIGTLMRVFQQEIHG